MDGRGLGAPDTSIYNKKAGDWQSKFHGRGQTRDYVEAAKQEEKEYYQRDDAKKRAVGQMAQWDEFCNIVAASGLKGVSSKELFDQGGHFFANGKVKSEAMPGHVKLLYGFGGRDFAVNAPTEAPATGADFQRDWRRNCPSPADKWRYFCLIEPVEESLAHQFKVELGAPILVAAADAMAQLWPLPPRSAMLAAASEGDAGEELEGPSGQGEKTREAKSGKSQGCEEEEETGAQRAFRVLSAFTTAGRFSLNVKLLGKDQKKKIADLWAKFIQDEAATGVPRGDIERLAAVYGVPPTAPA